MSMRFNVAVLSCLIQYTFVICFGIFYQGFLSVNLSEDPKGKKYNIIINNWETKLDF